MNLWTDPSDIEKTFWPDVRNFHEFLTYLSIILVIIGGDRGARGKWEESGVGIIKNNNYY